MKPETKDFLKKMAILIPVATCIITGVDIALYAADAYHDGLGSALGVGLIIALIAGTTLAIERGWLD